MNAILRSRISLDKQNDLPTCSVGLDLTEEPRQHEGQHGLLAPWVSARFAFLNRIFVCVLTRISVDNVIK